MFKNIRENKSENTQPIILPTAPGLLGIKSADQMLANHSGLINHIDELTGLSKNNFDRFYLTAIYNFARFVQQLPASEVHHHAGPGGMLAHTLEVCIYALKVRRSHLLSETGGAEEISAKQDVWTYAVFMAALCHDLAKVAVDQTITIYDSQHQTAIWDPWNQFMDEQGIGYTTEFIRNRHYRLHEKASPLLVYKVIPSYGMKWISSDQAIFSRWLACISGDTENASSIGEIVSIADSKSVAANLGADNSRMPTVKTKPLHEKMLTALRHLLMEGGLPLNRNGAAGWLKGNDCWLVSKRTVDAIRDQLTQEGHFGIPTKNGRMFDILQEHGVIVPFGEKAIWSATVEGEGWSHDLTLIKVATNKIWVNPSQRPSEFEGRIIVADVKPLDDNENEVLGSIDLKNKPQEKEVPLTKTESTEPKKESITENALLEKVEDNNLELRHNEFSDSLMEDTDLLAFLPSLNSGGQDDLDDTESDDFEKNKIDVEGIIPETIKQLVIDSSISKKSDENSENRKKSLTVLAGLRNNTDQVSVFFEWLQNGIQAGSLKTNQAKARIHTVNEGVILITPGIFQDFARSQDKENPNWSAIQQKVLKKNWHIRDGKGLNIVKYQVKGKSKLIIVNAVLFEDRYRVFGSKVPPDSNPHLSKVDSPA